MSWLLPKKANLLFLTFSFFAFGCASSGATTSVIADTNIVETETEGDKQVQRFDLNGDGAADMEKVFRASALPSADGSVPQPKSQKDLLEKRMDLDYNGTFDVHSYYDQGDLARERIDLDFDGKPDVENIFKGGKLAERRMAPGFDGKYSVWKFFNDKGALYKKARDTDANSRPDEWEYYKDQKLIRVGFDRDGDGEPEYFEDIKD